MLLKNQFLFYVSPDGVGAFSEFLRKEFATENIYFWAACERYRQIQNDQERFKEAQEIYAKHMGIGALEPVNVDSKARTDAMTNLPSADIEIFAGCSFCIFQLYIFIMTLILTNFSCSKTNF